MNRPFFQIPAAHHKMSTSSTMNPSLSKFNAAINTCRDLLRKEGITGMDSMKHLTLYILARALDRKECKRLTISETFAWETFLELAKVDSKRQECYDLLYNKNGGDLISHLDSIFGTRNFNFKLSNPDNHRAILKVLDGVNLKELEGTVDILGTVYENHLGSGSNKSAMRDLGQFFTDRRVCSYMTKLCSPQVFEDGRAESVLDPTMGTGGFLTAYVKYLKDQGASVNWSAMQMDIAGYDIDDFVMSIGRINMYLSTGVVFERIAHRDTLHTDIGDGNQRLTFKIILANMPFGVKGLKFADCCKRVKELKCDGTKSEPLFLNLMMAALDDGGRCAVVVPDGVLVNNSKQHTSTRTSLLETFELKRVIKMKGQFFSNTGIQPSILFFEKTGKPTEVVEFWDVEQDASGRVLEKLVVAVPRSKLDASSSLDPQKYSEESQTLRDNDFPLVSICDLVEIKNGKNIPERDRKESGAYPYYASNGIKGYVDEFLFEGPATLLGDQGSAWAESLQFVKPSEKFYAGNHTLVMKAKTEAVEIQYIFYTLLLLVDLQKYNKAAALIPEIDKARFSSCKIPLPPLSVQHEIVSALSQIYSTASTAKASASALKAQMTAVVQSVETRGYEKKKLGELLQDHIVKKPVSTKDAVPGEYTLYSSSCDVYSHSSFEFPPGEYLLQGSRGTISKATHYTTSAFSTSNNVFVLSSKDSSKLLLKYAYYYLITTSIADSTATTAVIPMLTKQMMQGIEIPLPPLALQQEALALLTEMDVERKMLERMTAKAEERAKFILDGYLTRQVAENYKTNENGEIVFDE